MKHATSALVAVALFLSIGGCESSGDNYASADANGRGSSARLRGEEGQVAADAGGNRAERRVEASAQPKGEGKREGDRTQFTMAYPTGERNSSVLLIEKTVPNQVRLNQPFQYDIKVTNISGATLDDVRVREETPEGLSITEANPQRQGQGAEAAWEIGALKPKESKTIRVSAVAAKQGQLGTCVLASYQPSLCAMVNVVNPQLQVTKRAPERADICEELVWEYTATNTGTGATGPVVIREQLPEGLTTQSGGGVVEMDAGSIREGQTKTGRVKLKAARSGRFTGRATASSADGLQAQSAETTTLITQPKLAINIEGPESEYVDRPIAYRVTVTNQGDGPARDAVASVAVPGASKLVNVGTEGRTDRNVVQWNLGALEPNASKTITFTLSGTEAANLSTVARAKATCAEEVADTAQTKIMTIPALVLEAVDLSDPVRVGENITYRISVTNQGSGNDNNIRVTARLPEQMQYVSARGTTQATAEGQTVRFAPVQTLAPGRNATWELTAKAGAAGDVRFEVQLESESLTKPANENEPTRLY
jgi:uncharacterized repeat protein (TIGR01451 family)